MSSTRPKRSLRQMNYKDMMDSGSEDADSASSVSDLSYKDLLEQPTSKREDEEVVHDVSSDLIQLPTASDILETEARIRTQTARIAAVEAEYKVMKRKMAAFEAKRLSMIDELLRDKAYLARIRILPQEILGIIFLFYTSDPAQSPWTLMQVTRTWRATALATRSLWAGIRITSPAWQKSGASRRKDGREVCGTKAQLYRALRRAGNAPLDIQFALSNPFCKRRYREYDKTSIHQMISLLASSRKCLQVHHLEIEGSDRYHLERWDGVDYEARRRFPRLVSDIEDDLEAPVPQAMDGEPDLGSPPPQKMETEDDAELSRWLNDENGLEFPELRTLRVKSRGYVSFVMKISETSKLVTSIDYVLASPERDLWMPTFIPPGLQSDSRIGLENFIQYPSLVSLSLNGRLFEAYDGNEVHTLKHVLDNTPSLTTLELTSLHLSENAVRSGDWPLRLPNLQHLILKRQSHPWSLDAPNLTSLSLFDDSYIRKGPRTLEANNFPLLTTLTVDWSIGGYTTLWYGYITFPLEGIHTLDVCFGTRKQLITDLVKYQAKLNPVVFHLRKTVISTELLIKVIDSMDRLEELQLENVGFKKEFFEFLGSKKTSDDREPAVVANCPKLVRLQVKLKSGSHAQNKSLKAAARKAVGARIKAGIVMETWLIRSSEDQKWLNCLNA